MRKVIAAEYITLDGVIEAPGGETSLGANSGWSFRLWNDEAAKIKTDELFATDTILLGRVTYDIFAAAWPTMTDDTGFADRMNQLPKYVVSTTLSTLDWNNSHLIADNLVNAVTNLKQQQGQDILIYGSAELVHTLRQHNLIDEYRILLFPIVLGVGKRLFQDGSNAPLTLTSSQTLKTGVVYLTYQPTSTAQF